MATETWDLPGSRCCSIFTACGSSWGRHDKQPVLMEIAPKNRMEFANTMCLVCCQLLSSLECCVSSHESHRDVLHTTSASSDKPVAQNPTEISDQLPQHSAMLESVWSVAASVAARWTIDKVGTTATLRLLHDAGAYAKNERSRSGDASYQLRYVFGVRSLHAVNLQSLLCASQKVPNGEIDAISDWTHLCTLTEQSPSTATKVDLGGTIAHPCHPIPSHPAFTPSPSIPSS